MECNYVYLDMYSLTFSLTQINHEATSVGHEMLKAKAGVISFLDKKKYSLMPFFIGLIDRTECRHLAQELEHRSLIVFSAVIGITQLGTTQKNTMHENKKILSLNSSEHFSRISL